MNVLVTGAAGQLGRALLAAAPDEIPVTGVVRDTLDLTRPEMIEDVFTQVRPAVVINAAAYTAVDAAESDRDAAFAVNAEGVKQLAATCAKTGARLLHVSTDFVFDGTAHRPYLPDSEPRPIGVYGASKLAGEKAVMDMPDLDWVIMRTAWVYAAAGSNFMLTMLRVMRERDDLGVVADQIGSPTWACALAGALWQCVARPDVRGIQHWTDSGVASWYDFAVAIQEEATVLGLVPGTTSIRPIRTEDFPTPAARPPFSVLDKTATRQALALPGVHWRENLRKVLRELSHG